MAYPVYSAVHIQGCHSFYCESKYRLRVIEGSHCVLWLVGMIKLYFHVSKYQFHLIPTSHKTQ